LGVLANVIQVLKCVAIKSDLKLRQHYYIIYAKSFATDYLIIFDRVAVAILQKKPDGYLVNSD
jgi:hypothetical protein